MNPRSPGPPRDVELEPLTVSSPAWISFSTSNATLPVFFVSRESASTIKSSCGTSAEAATAHRDENARRHFVCLLRWDNGELEWNRSREECRIARDAATRARLAPGDHSLPRLYSSPTHRCHCHNERCRGRRLHDERDDELFDWPMIED